MTKEQREDIIKKIEEMPEEELTDLIVKALNESGINYKIMTSEELDEGYITLQEFFFNGCLTNKED